MNKRVKIALYVFFDVVTVTLAWLLGALISSYSIVTVFTDHYLMFAISLFATLIINFAMGLYRHIWKYAGIREMIRTIAAIVCTMLVNCTIAILSEYFSLGWAFVTGFVYSTVLVLGRFFEVIFAQLVHFRKVHSDDETSRVIIIGGGGAGSMLLREIMTTDKINITPVCVLDDDENKIGQSINGVKIVGASKDVVKFAKKFDVDEIFIAMPSVDKKRISEIIVECKKTNCKVKKLPGLYQFTDGKLSVSSVKEVSINDLLGREQVSVNLDEIMGYIENKVVLVTGGGGSIGSELCRQIASHNPKQLIIFDIYENNAYSIEQELLRNNPSLNLLTLIGSVRDSKKIDKLFETYHPQIVFHAAAHKHVPLMETSPNEAVKNNVSGTYKVADATGRYGAERFILISTDKAVNPTNIMGATKRICEMIIQTMDKKYETDYVAVRFGNVLGSNGSVIPLFSKQINEGGPVTVTHKDIVRYFMTIPEAVSLVLQAGAYANGGEIFVLDMGEPVRIYDLAENMIRLSGLEPGKDIEIKITGLRPGEKLYEERLMEEEGLQKTPNQMISIGKPLVIDEKNLFDKIQELYVEAYNETDRMKELVHELVPTYKIDKGNN